MRLYIWNFPKTSSSDHEIQERQEGEESHEHSSLTESIWKEHEEFLHTSLNPTKFWSYTLSQSDQILVSQLFNPTKFWSLGRMVEDNFINQQVFRKQVENYLKEKGIHEKVEISVFSDGKQALDHLLKNETEYIECPPIILTDIDMPVMSGLEMTKNIRERFGSGIVIHSITASMVCDPQEYKKKHQFDGYRPKPVRFTEMKEDLDMLTKLHHERTEKEMPSFQVVETDRSESTEKVASGILILILQRLVNSGYAQGIMKDLGMSCFTCVVISFLYIFVPPFNGLVFAMISSTILHYGIIFPTLLFFNVYPSTQSMTILTNLRHFFAILYGTYANNFTRQVKDALVAHASLIFQVCDQTESVHAAFCISLLWYVHFIVGEILRFHNPLFNQFLNCENCENFVDMSVLSEDMIYDHEFVIFVADVTTSIYLYIVFIAFAFTIVKTTRIRRERIQLMLEEKRMLHCDFEHTMAETTNHLLCLSEKIKGNLETVKKILFGRSFFDDSDRTSFDFLCSSSVSLHLSIRNFLICCAVQLKRRRGRRRSSVFSVIGYVRLGEFLQGIVDEFGEDVVTIEDIGGEKLSEEQVLVDMDSLSMILSNLVNNCFVHGEGKHVKVKYRIVGGMIEVLVSDEGEGISAEESMALVDTKKQKKDLIGSAVVRGMGLITVKLIIEELGGTVSVSSSKIDTNERKKGTEIGVSFPAEKYCL